MERSTIFKFGMAHLFRLGPWLNHGGHLYHGYVSHNQRVIYIYIYMVGGFNHLEKYESQREWLSDISHILWKIKNVWNHQPDIIWDNGTMGVRMGVEPWHQNYDKTIICLVVSTYPSEKYESQMELLFPIYIYIWKNIKCSKPPTSNDFFRSGYLKTCCFLDTLQEVHSD